MDDSNKKQFLVIISGLAVEFGGKAQNDNIKIRFEALKEYPIENISKAATWLLKNRIEKYPPIPTTREIISAIEKINGKLQAKTAASLECDKVFRNLKRFGRDCPTDFTDPITKYLMTHRWSFHQIGNQLEKDLKWFRRDFVEAYQDMDNQKVDTIEYSGKQGTISVDNLKQLLPKNK